MKKNNSYIRGLSLIVIFYMLLALGWWTFLLLQKNKAYYEVQLQLETLEQSKPSQSTELTDKYYRQRAMILGEAIVFAISLLLGIWLINRGYRREVAAAKQSKNFLLSITHELKSPLASIKLVLQTFRRRQLEATQYQTLSENALEETDRLQNIVENLLLAAKMEQTFSIQKERFDLRELLAEELDFFKNQNPHATFNFFSNKEKISITGDADTLRIAFSNLLSNALKYSPKAPSISVSLLGQESKVVLEVKDKGTGIPDAERQNIFKKFYRVGNEDTRTTQGTGLGLYIVAQIIKAHHGKIKVLNNQPQGSIFSVSIPTKI